VVTEKSKRTAQLSQKACAAELKEILWLLRAVARTFDELLDLEMDDPEYDAAVEDREVCFRRF
jgi:hypothetical protein